MSNNELYSTFVSESEKLEKKISDMQKKSEKFSISEIVSIYYQIMNVNSLLEILKQDNQDNEIAEKISQTEQEIKTNFDNSLHTLILSQLTETIQEYMDTLKANKGKPKTKDTIQQDAKLYEELREYMSTKEFVEQYDKGMK